MAKFSARFGLVIGVCAITCSLFFAQRCLASNAPISTPSISAPSASTPTGAGEIYDLKLELTLDGKVSSPRLIVQDGRRASIEQVSQDTHTFVEVTATGNKLDRKQIMVDLVVGTIDRAGTRTIVSNPRILANENERAQITIQNDEGSGNLSLAVVARRKLL